MIPYKKIVVGDRAKYRHLYDLAHIGKRMVKSGLKRGNPESTINMDIGKNIHYPCKKSFKNPINRLELFCSAPKNRELAIDAFLVH